jgi:hypothetical protein
MVNLLWLALLIAAAIGLLTIAHQMEPHWASKDGESFTCRIQTLSDGGRRASARWSDARAILVDGGVVLARRGIFASRHEGDEPRRVAGRATGGSGRFAVFLLEGNGPLLALRVPAESAAADRLDELVRH